MGQSIVPSHYRLDQYDCETAQKTFRVSPSEKEKHTKKKKKKKNSFRCCSRAPSKKNFLMNKRIKKKEDSTELSTTL